MTDGYVDIVVLTYIKNSTCFQIVWPDRKKQTKDNYENTNDKESHFIEFFFKTLSTPKNGEFITGLKGRYEEIENTFLFTVTQNE